MEKTLTLLLTAALLGAAAYFAFVMTRDEKPPAPVVPSSAGPARPEKPPTRPVPAEPPAAEKPAGPAGAPDARIGPRKDAISGVVRDGAGQPVADADVQFVEYNYAAKRARAHELLAMNVVAKAVTDPDGRYEIVLPAGAQTPKSSLLAQKPGYLVQFKDLVGPGVQVDFTLRPGVAVSGRVVDDATGEPAVGAFVKGWFATEGERDADRAFRWQEELRTDAKGEFRFSGAPAGVVKFLVFHDDFYDYVEDRRLADGGPIRLEFRLKRGVPVVGLVRDAVTRKPLVGVDVQVAVAPTFFFPRGFATTDAEGRFRVTAETGPVRFNFSAKGYAMQAASREISPADAFVPAKNNVLEFELKPAASAAGVVRDAEGRPVAGAKICVGELSLVFWKTRGDVEAETDAEGRYLVGELLPDATYKIAAADATGYVALSEEFKPAAGEVRDGVDVRFPRGGGVNGRVADEGGAPVAGAQVTLSRPPFYGITIPPGLSFGQKGFVTTQTDASGRYAFDRLWTGDHALTVDHPDYVLSDGEPVKIREAEEIVTQDVKLVRGGDVRGRVLDADGKPATGAEVRAYAPLTSEAVAVAVVDAATGDYALLRLRPGEYRLRASRADTAESALPQDGVRPGGARVDFVLAKNPAVLGNVVDQSGRVVTRFELTLRPTVLRSPSRAPKPPPGGLSPIRTEIYDEGGLFRIPNVLPGRYVADLTAPGYAATRGPEFEITSFADHNLGALTLRSGGILRGRVVDERGAPVPEADVHLTRIGGGPIPETDQRKSNSTAGADALKSVKTDASGTFVADAVPQGQYLVRFESPRHVPSSPTQISLMDGAEEKQDGVLRRANGVMLEVRDDGGDPVSNCLLHVFDAEGRPVPMGSGTDRTARTNGEGLCTLPRLPLGPVTIKLTRSGWHCPDVGLTVVEGPVERKTILMNRIIR